jgi:hypothetical protein
MAEETKVETTAEAGIQEASKQTTTDAKVESKPVSIREQMFGKKVKTAEPVPPSDDAKAKEQPADTKPAEGKETPKEGDTEPAHGKNSAKERIQESRREVKKWKAEAEAKAAEIERLTAEVNKYHAMKTEDMSPRDQLKEVYAEEKLNELHTQLHQELVDYCDNCEDPQMFETNYNYYTPLLQKEDPWTMQQIMKFPEKLKMFDLFFQTITNGTLDVNAWIKSPQPVKMNCLRLLQKQANGENTAVPANAEPAKAEPPKVVADSVVPDLKKGGTSEIADKSKGSTFYKVFNKGVR